MDKLQLAQSFQPYLTAGERVVWTGRPKRGFVLSSKDGLLIPFSLIWGGFALFWNAGVWGIIGGNEAPVFFRLWGLPFLTVGLYVIFGRFLHDAYIRKGLRYAVTNQRVLVLRKSKITSLDVQRLPRLELSEFHDTTGTLNFEAERLGSWSEMNGISWWVPSLSGAAQFFRIENARTVYELVQRHARS